MHKKDQEEKELEITAKVKDILNNYDVADEVQFLFLDYHKQSYGLKEDDIREYRNLKTFKPFVFISNYPLNLQYAQSKDSRFQLDGRRNYFNSSIWFYTLDLSCPIRPQVAYISTKIKECKELKLFDLNVTKEFYDFIFRLYNNSYLQVGGHSSYVTPFKFHSEATMKEKITEDKLKEKIKPYKWRLLLIDDYADKPLKVSDQVMEKIIESIKQLISKESDGYKFELLFKLPKIKLKNQNFSIKDFPNEDYSENEIDELKKLLTNISDQVNKLLELLPPSKQEILEHVLKDCKENFEIISYSSVNGFIQNYSKDGVSIHDIILLDYLLAPKGDTGSREYSTELLEWIKNQIKAKRENKKMQLKESLKGPLDKFWFFPISVFSYAFIEDIRQMGYTQYDDDWVIARGADPVNTPELFRYSLFKFMEAQLNDAGIKLEEVGRSENNFLIDFLIQIFANPRMVTEENLKENYKKFHDKKQNFEILYKDYENNSLFAESVLKVKDDERELKAFHHSLNHLHHLYYLMAFTSPYEWPMMRAEYDRIETEYANQGINITNHPLWEKVFELIKNYREIAGSR